MDAAGVAKSQHLLRLLVESSKAEMKTLCLLECGGNGYECQYVGNLQCLPDSCMSLAINLRRGEEKSSLGDGLDVEACFLLVWVEVKEITTVDHLGIQLGLKAIYRLDGTGRGWLCSR